MKFVLDQDALALPPALVGDKQWSVVSWIAEGVWNYRHDIAFYGLRWLALSLIFAALWSIVMHFFGHTRDDD